METISLKSNARKMLAKQKGLSTNRDSSELFLECQFSLFLYKYDIFFIYIPAILGGFHYFIL